MSRIGKVPVPIPKEVKIKNENGNVIVEGPKGKLSLRVPAGISVDQKDDSLIINRVNDAKQNRSNHGTIRAVLSSMINGVTKGHKRNLEIKGVGFKAQIQGQKLVLNLGFSHPVEIEIPQGIKVVTPKPTSITIEGIDNALVGQIAASIRKIKPPEPYKGKGVRYEGEVVKRKQGKSVTK